MNKVSHNFRFKKKDFNNNSIIHSKNPINSTINNRINIIFKIYLMSTIIINYNSKMFKTH